MDRNCTLPLADGSMHERAQSSQEEHQVGLDERSKTPAAGRRTRLGGAGAMIRRRGRTAGGSCLGRPRVQETETETGQPAVRDALHLSDIADVHALWGVLL